MGVFARIRKNHSPCLDEVGNRAKKHLGDCVKVEEDTRLSNDSVLSVRAGLSKEREREKD